MDILQREGNYPAPAGCTQIMGVEFSGHIAALGDGVSGDWRVGDEIMGLAGGVNTASSHYPVVQQQSRTMLTFPIQGAYADHIVVHHKMIVKKPAHLTWVEAASVLETFLTGDYRYISEHAVAKVTLLLGRTAFQALVFCGDLKSGVDVLVHAGASGVGVAACQIARLYGA